MHEVQYGNFLIHYNKNHAPKGSKQGGQFVSGDGDGDGIVDDHHHYSKNKSDLKSTQSSRKTKISIKRRYELLNGRAKNVTEEERAWLKKNQAQNKAVAFYLANEALSAELAAQQAEKNGDYATAQHMRKYSDAAFDGTVTAGGNALKGSVYGKRYDKQN